MTSSGYTSHVLLLGTLFPIITAAQQLIASPTTIDIGLTRFLQIGCTFTKDSTIVLTSNIRILFSNTTDQPVFRQLGLVDYVVGIDNSSGAVDSGVIVRNGMSNLRLTWNYPEPDRAGVYRCEVRGKNLNGVQKTKSQTVEVTAVVPDQETFLEYFQKLTSDFEDLKTSSADVKLLQSELNARLDRGKSQFFRVTDVYQGRRYYLSAYSNVLVTGDAEAMCELFGGYLVEIDSAEEYQFIAQFLSTFSRYYFILTGGGDELLENNWVNAYSRTPVKYINWVPGEPNGGRGENCIYFCSYCSWAMIDAVCYTGLTDQLVGYVCEIPE